MPRFGIGVAWAAVTGCGSWERNENVHGGTQSVPPLGPLFFVAGFTLVRSGYRARSGMSTTIPKLSATEV